MIYLSICKKAKFLVPFLFLFVNLSLQAQSVILSGKVVDKNQQPLVGATIKVATLKKGTTTDLEGKFQLNIPSGTYKIEISYVGYKPKSFSTILNQNKMIEVQLFSEEYVLDEVLVEAVRVKPNAPVTHSNLSKKEISKRNLGQDIPVLIKYLPSVTSSTDAGAGVGYTYMRVRGSDATRINVTVNGIPYNDSESQGTFFVNMGDFASSTQSLQLQRGVGTSTNGSGAFGASLNILTDAVSEQAGGEISNSFGSYSTKKHTIKYTTGKLNNHFEISGRLSKIYSDGYVDRAFTDLKSYFLQGSYTDDNTLLKVLVFGGKEKTYQAWYGLSKKQLEKNRRQNPYTYDNETDNYQQDHYQLHWNEKLTNNWTTNIGVNYTRGKGYYEQFKKKKKAKAFNNIIVDGSDVIVRRWLDNHFYVLNANATYKNEKVEIIGGTSFSFYKGDHFGEVIWARELSKSATIRDRYYFNDATKTDYSAFAKATFKVTNSLKAFIDVQGRFIDYKTAGIDSDRSTLDVHKNYNFFNPKAGLTYTINNKNSVYISYARANREPNRNDFKNGKDVQHETLNDFELGWRLKTNRIKLSINAYYMGYENQLIQTGGLNDVGAYLRENVKDSYRAGLEFDANISISDKFSFLSNITISTNKIKNFMLRRDGTNKNIGTTNIAFSPNIITGNTLLYQPIKGLQFALMGKYVGSQYLSNTDTKDSEIAGYFVSDLNINYELKTTKVFKSIIFTGMINNVLNKEYVDRGYTYLNNWDTPGTSFEVQGYYPQATRNYLAGITLIF